MLPRVASASVCDDQYLLRLADPSQIAALSTDAAEHRLSHLAALADGYPRVAPGAEAYLAHGVDLVLASAFIDAKALELLQRFGVRVVHIPFAEGFEDVPGVIELVAKAIGQPDRGAALIADFNRRWTALKDEAAGAGRVALYLRSGGGSAGAGTFIDAIMAANGLANKATLDGRNGWTSYNLESFVQSPPSLLIAASQDDEDHSLLNGFALHPAFARRAADIPVLQVPAASLVCSGWTMIDAAEALAASLRKLPFSALPVPDILRGRQ